MSKKDLSIVATPQSLPIPAFSKTAPVESLEAYIRFTHSVPMLSAEEEKSLALRLKYQNDIEAAQKLILSHLRFVVKIARDFSGYGLPQADLIQEGNIGLMKAVRRFDPNMDVRLVSFAVHWIKAEIHDYVIRNWRIVKVATTKAQRKLFFNLRASKKRLGWMSQEEIAEVAQALNVKPEEVSEMEARLNAHDAAFELPDEDTGEDTYSPAQYLAAPNSDPSEALEAEDWERANHESLNKAFDTLDARSQDILQQRWLNEDKATLHDLAAKYQVSAERIRQLENNALNALKKSLT